MVISSDEKETPSRAIPSDDSEDEQPVRPQKRNDGKLKPVNNSTEDQQLPPQKSTPDASSQNSPAKSKVTKTKSKAAFKDHSKANGRPIYSFFNATTQRQQPSQPSASQHFQKGPDAIQDESDEAPGTALEPSKGSSVALAMRKRKLGHSESFEIGANLPLPGSQKFRKANSGERATSLSFSNEDKRPWTEQYAPLNLSELAVHRGKVLDVRKWLEAALNGRRQKVLVLKGAAGTGKTTALRLLAQDMKVAVVEWKNHGVSEQGIEGSASTASQFQEFVGRAGASGGLQLATDGYDTLSSAVQDETASDSRAQLLLVEEFPSTFSRSSSTLQRFRSTILQYLSSPALANSQPTPVVMVISETLLSTTTALADSFTAHRLLGPELTNHPFLDIIEFNLVARTILTKALETIVVKEARRSGRRKTPGPQVIQQLAESGDIRSAISSLEFLCLRGDDGDIWSSKVTFTKQKKPKTEPRMTKFEEDALKLICNRESTLGIFHAVGKVMYNKRKDPSSSTLPIHPPSWLPQYRRNKVWENDADEMLNDLGTDVATFIAALHENYPLSCSSNSAEDTLGSLFGCAHSVSDADLLSLDRFAFGSRAFSGSATDSLRQDEMAFHTAVRGMLFSLPHPVSRAVPAGGKRGDEHKVFYPSALKLWRKREELEGTLELLTSKFQGESVFAAVGSDTRLARGASGVESWKRNSGLSADASAQANDGNGPLRSSSAKVEMLIERLPYMAQILPSKSTSSTLSLIHAVTRVRGTVSTLTEDDAGEDEDDEGLAEQWSTDRPDTDGGKGLKKDQAGLKKGHTKGTEGGGLAIPVESRVEKLVLEDDDIVDD